MGNRRFSVTTYVLVGISLVALYFVGKTVNPPPPAPPQEVAAPAAKPSPTLTPAQAQAQKKEMTERAMREQTVRLEQMKKLAAQKKTKPLAKADKFNPTGIDTDADYWHNYDMGAKGEVEMDAKVAAAKAKMKPRPSVPQIQSSKPLTPVP